MYPYMVRENDNTKPNKLGSTLKKARLEAHLTQAQVATQSGIHVNFYARLERGEVDVSFERLEKILKTLGIESLKIG
jgi:transcriptional regulator with XRE-family HTH domain